MLDFTEVNPGDPGGNLGGFLDDLARTIRTGAAAVRDATDEIRGRPVQSERRRSANIGLLLIGAAVVIFFARRR